MKTKIYIIFTLFFILCGAFNVVSAQSLTEYELLAPIPLNGSGGVTERTTATQFIPGLFKLTIMLATGLAVLFIIWGGVQYMSTDAFTGKESAKETIWNAVMGLLLALSAWLIIATVNPKLMTFDLSIERFEIPTDTNRPASGGTGGGGETLPGYTLTPDQIAADQAIETRLGQNNPPVRVNNAPCATGNTSGCTNVVGLPEGALSGVMNLASSCQTATTRNCNVIISGGTEGGHVTHGPNRPVVDLGKNSTLDSYITRNGQAVNTQECSQLGPQYRLGGAMYVNEGNHWHVCY